MSRVTSRTWSGRRRAPPAECCTACRRHFLAPTLGDGDIPPVGARWRFGPPWCLCGSDAAPPRGVVYASPLRHARGRSPPPSPRGSGAGIALNAGVALPPRRTLPAVYAVGPLGQDLRLEAVKWGRPHLQGMRAVRTPSSGSPPPGDGGTWTIVSRLPDVKAPGALAVCGGPALLRHAQGTRPPPSRIAPRA